MGTGYLKCGYWVLSIICEGSGREALFGKRKGRKEERKKRPCVECFGAWRKWFGKKEERRKKRKKK